MCIRETELLNFPTFSGHTIKRTDHETAVNCATFRAVTKLQSCKCKKNFAAKAHALTLLISRAIGTQQPRALPTFRWRPDLVSGIPIERESFAFALDRPMARFQEKDRPGILNLRDIFYIQRLLFIGLPQFQ